MTDKELRILDEMLTNLEIWSTWNKTFANEMIGICSKMRNLLADRKTESNSEKPNNSTISKMEQVDEPQTYVINPQEPTNDDKCFECDDFFTCDGQCNKVKDEPQTDNGIGCSRCEGRYDCYDRDMPNAVHCNNYGKVTDEPQTDCPWK